MPAATGQAEGQPLDHSQVTKVRDRFAAALLWVTAFEGVAIAEEDGPPQDEVKAGLFLANLESLAGTIAICTNDRAEQLQMIDAGARQLRHLLEQTEAAHG
jgi:hypothetical protein